MDSSRSYASRLKAPDLIQSRHDKLDAARIGGRHKEHENCSFGGFWCRRRGWKSLIAKIAEMQRQGRIRVMSTRSCAFGETGESWTSLECSTHTMLLLYNLSTLFIASRKDISLPRNGQHYFQKTVIMSHTSHNLIDLSVQIIWVCS